MDHAAALAKANEIAGSVLAPAARQNDKEGRFSSDAVDALGRAGLLGLTLPAEHGGSGLGPRSFAAVTATLAEADASVAMVYLMHVCAVATILAARPDAAIGQTLHEIAADGISRPSPSVRPARAATSGRLSRGRAAMRLACT
jgi:alkylation response protein AidB-like acyl-CoA dehydrogenase